MQSSRVPPLISASKSVVESSNVIVGVAYVSISKMFKKIAPSGPELSRVKKAILFPVSSKGILYFSVVLLLSLRPMSAKVL